MTEIHQIRAAQLSDAAEIARLTIELGYSVSVQEISSRLTALLPSINYFAAVAEGKDSQLLGWAVVEHRVLLQSDAKAELTGLIVSASARRKGIGKALVAAAEKWATKHCLSSICVRSNVARLESHPFYQNLGYIRGKTQHFYEKQLFHRY